MSAARRLVRRYRGRLLGRLRRAAVEPGAANGAAPAAAPPAPPRETLVRALERGRTVDDSIVAQVRSAIRAGDHDTARAIAESLRVHPDTRALGHLTGGIVAYRQGYLDLAWDEFRAVPRELWATLAMAEYVRAGLAVSPDETLSEIRALIADDPGAVNARRWFDALAPVFGFGAQDVAREIFEVFDRHVGERSPVWAQAEAHRNWMRPWVAADAGSPTAPQPGGRRTFAVVDYGHPGAKRASANIGDHVQSIASLGHLVRHRGVRLHGDGDLLGLLEQLGGRTRPELRRDDVDADLEVMTVHRDASMYEAIPEDTWVLCFGWYMHALFSMRHGFPLHRNLRPIFISFHCNKRDLLTPEAVEYLKRYGPVGCRDWTTVYLLLSLGVPAFFSGCLTTTINTVFPDPAAGPPAGAPVAYVDAAPEDVPEDGVTYKHSSPAVRRRSFAENVYAALDLLETYRDKHRAVVTSRLHCYLPVRSLGVDVDFRPKNPSDVRFDGLLGIDDAAFDAIRDGITDKLEQVFTAILTGRPEDEVYALWREITADEVAAAEARRMRPARLDPVAADIEGQVEYARSAAVTHERTAPAPAGDAVHCAVLLRKRSELPLSVLVASLIEHASRPLHVWVLAVPGADVDERRVADRFPQAAFSWVPLRGLGRDLRTPAAKQPSPAAIVRLLLADLLKGVDRLVLLPLPAVATADVAELADLDLGGHLLAAPTKPGTVGSSGFGMIHTAAARLRRRTQAAAELRRTAHARHAFDFDAFTDDVLVLDLARMRETRFSGQALALVEKFGLSGLEALHYLTGPDRATVPEQWATVPTRTPLRGPGLVHWADRVKPWQAVLTPERERWRTLAAAVEQRNG